MSTRFTENIDNLDEFYRQSFEDGGIEPPADMWDRVEATLDSEDKRKKGFFSKRNLLIALVAVLLSSLLICWLLILTDTSISDSKVPEPNNKKSTIIQSNEKSTTISNESREVKKRIQRNKNASPNATSAESNAQNNSSTDTSTNEVIPEITQKTDSNVVAPPKKRLRFRDKYKKMPSDTLPLFIPE